MNQAKLILVAALVGLSSAAMADSTTDRDQRMNSALENYRSSDAAAKNPEPGPAARAEKATKRGARKAGDALRRTGEKIRESTTSAK